MFIEFSNRSVVATAAFALLVALSLLTTTTDAFVKPAVSLASLNGGGWRGSSSSSSSPSTQVNLFDFLKEGKKALVKSLAGEYDEVAIQARMKDLIDSNPVFMFSFTTCPFCIKAKKVLDGLDAKYTVVELDTDTDGKAIRAEMADLVGRTSVPAIWIGGEFVGGCNDGPMGGVVNLNERGKLVDLLKGVDAL